MPFSTRGSNPYLNWIHPKKKQKMFIAPPQRNDCDTPLHTPRHCLDMKHIICPRSVYRQKNSKKQHCTKAMLSKIATLSKKQHCTTAMIATLTHIVCRSFGYRQKKTARSLHRPEGMIATRTYIQLCLDRKHIMDATTECDRWSEHNRSFFDSASRLAVRRDTQQTEWNMNGCSQDKHPDDRMQPPNATKKCNEEMSHRRLLVDHGDSTSNVEKLLRGRHVF